MGNYGRKRRVSERKEKGEENMYSVRRETREKTLAHQKNIFSSLKL